MSSNGSVADFMSKVPAVTLGFWIIKILATTLGETAGDSVTMSWLGETTPNAIASAWHIGYLIGTAILIVPLVLLVIAQIRAPKFHPLPSWKLGDHCAVRRSVHRQARQHDGCAGGMGLQYEPLAGAGVGTHQIGQHEHVRDPDLESTLGPGRVSQRFAAPVAGPAPHLPRRLARVVRNFDLPAPKQSLRAQAGDRQFSDEFDRWSTCIRPLSVGGHRQLAEISGGRVRVEGYREAVARG